MPVYLTARGLGALEVGGIATLVLFGSALTTLGVGLLGAHADQRRLLIAGSTLMVVTGLAFAASSADAVEGPVAVLETSTPPPAVSVFLSRSNMLLSRSVVEAERRQMFARYGLVGALATTLGALAPAAASGWHNSVTQVQSWALQC